jgi:hypothetical protein
MAYAGSKFPAFLPAGKIRGPRPGFFPLFAFAKLDPALLVSPLFSPVPHRELPYAKGFLG